LTIDLHTAEGTATLTAHGEVDLGTVGQLSDALAAVTSSAQVVDVDLADVSYMDSGGLRSLLIAKSDIEQLGGRLRVTAASSTVDRLLEVAGVAEILYQRG
jgi:stage II sporulation protein AA (anti-sigma F factor antagonist)